MIFAQHIVRSAHPELLKGLVAYSFAMSLVSLVWLLILAHRRNR